MKSLKNKIGSFFDKRENSTATITVLIICAVMVLNVILCYLTQVFGLYIYAAEYTEDFTISGMSDEIFSDAIEAGEKITITFFMDRAELDAHATGGFVLDTVEQFAQRYKDDEHGDFITLRYVNTFTKLDQNGERVDIAKYEKNERGEDVTLSRTAVAFESSKGHRVLSNVRGNVGFVDFYTFDSSGEVVSFNGETIITSMICWVLADEHKTAYVTANHAEENDANFATMLAASGYYINSINLQDSDVPEDAAMVIISNPKYDFERAAAGSGIITEIETEIERLEQYVNRGGNLYVSLDPYVKRLDNLESFIERFGIKLKSGTTESGELRYLVRDSVDGINLDGYTLFAQLADVGAASAVSSTVQRYSDGKIILKDASVLELSGNAKPVLVTSAASDATLDGQTVNTDGSYAVAAHSTHTNTTDSGETTANIFVVSSIYICASDAVVSNEYANRDFLYALFEHMFGAENLPYGANSVTYISDDLKNLSIGDAKLYMALLLLIPLTVAVVGAVITIRRKNR